MTKTQQSEREEAISRLRETLKPGQTIYTQLKNVSRSGMQRVIQLVILEKNERTGECEPRWIGYSAAKAMADRYDDKREGIVIGGCGMDMGFALVYNLSHTLFGDGYKCLGKKGHCPSNYHNNHRDVLKCYGTPGEDGVPCFRDDDDVYRLRTGTGEEFGLGDVCPICKGKGEYPNPEGKERWDLMHTDGYALKHRWL